jgi:hypothetical protein
MAQGIIGPLEPFNPATLEWEVYEEKFLNFLAANGITAPAEGGADRRKAVLLAYIGDNSLTLLRSLCVRTQRLQRRLTSSCSC